MRISDSKMCVDGVCVSTEMALVVSVGFACCIMHQSGSVPQEPKGTDLVAVAAPHRAPGFTPHEGDMNNRG